MPAEEQWTELNSNLKEMVKRVDQYSSDFGSLRIWSKSSLIVLSSIVAAEKSFHFCGWSDLVSIFAIMVAAGTAAEAWIKPADKWRISSNYATMFAALHRKVIGIDPKDAAALVAAEKELSELSAKWLNDTTY